MQSLRGSLKWSAIVTCPVVGFCEVCFSDCLVHFCVMAAWCITCPTDPLFTSSLSRWQSLRSPSAVCRSLVLAAADCRAALQFNPLCCPTVTPQPAQRPAIQAEGGPLCRPVVLFSLPPGVLPWTLLGNRRPLSPGVPPIQLVLTTDDEIAAVLSLKLPVRPGLSGPARVGRG